MKKIVSFSLKQTTIDKIAKIANLFGISKSKLLDMEIEKQLKPLMPLVEGILKEQEKLKSLI